MASAHTTDAEIILALKAIQKHGSNRAAAREIGVHPSVIDKRLAMAKDRGLTAEMPIRDPLDKLREENRRLKAEINSIHKQNDTAEEIRRRIFQLREVPAEPPAWLMKSTPIGGPGVPMMLWSDWHAGEVVRKGEVGGLNEYNSKIFEKRVEILTERSIKLIRHHMPKGVPGIVINLGGDIITGEIHQELADTNDRYILETIRQTKSVLLKALTTLADEFGNVYVPCVVGNHGRMSLKPRLKGKVFTNYEWGIYCDLEDRLRDDKRIRFSVPDEADIFYSVLGHKFLLTHGDNLGVKGGDGIIGALGPIMRGAIKIGRQKAQVGRDFDTLLMGHWHQYIALSNLIVNNNLKGADELAMLLLRAPAAAASQALWFVDRKWGVNTQMEVYVQDPAPFRTPKTGKEAWVEVFKS